MRQKRLDNHDRQHPHWKRDKLTKKTSKILAEMVLGIRKPTLFLKELRVYRRCNYAATVQQSYLQT